MSKIKIVKQIMTKKEYWESLNKPVWTPIGLIGWMSFLAAQISEGFWWKIFFIAITTFSAGCWYIRKSKELTK